MCACRVQHRHAHACACVHESTRICARANGRCSSTEAELWCMRIHTTCHMFCSQRVHFRVTACPHSIPTHHGTVHVGCMHPCACMPRFGTRAHAAGRAGNGVQLSLHAVRVALPTVIITPRLATRGSAGSRRAERAFSPPRHRKPRLASNYQKFSIQAKLVDGAPGLIILATEVSFPPWRGSAPATRAATS